MRCVLLFYLLVAETTGIAFYPYGLSAGDQKTQHVDDACPHFYRYPISMFGNSFGKLYVCTNGLISMDKAYTAYSPMGFPLQDAQRTALICPYWADADNRNGGEVWSRESRDPALLQRASVEAADSYSTLTGYNATWMLIATWDNIAAYNSPTSKRNTFQAVVVSDGVTSLAIFNYKKIGWIAGPPTAKPAQVGFDSGDGSNFHAADNSRTRAIRNIISQSNVAIPGKFVFILGVVNSTVTDIVIPDKLSPPTTTPAATTPTTTVDTSVSNSTTLPSILPQNVTFDWISGNQSDAVKTSINQSESVTEVVQLQVFFADLSEMEEFVDDATTAAVVACVAVVAVLLVVAIAATFVCKHNVGTFRQSTIRQDDLRRFSVITSDY